MTLDSLTLDRVEIDCHCHVFHAGAFPVQSFLLMCLKRWAGHELGKAGAETAEALRTARSLPELRQRAEDLMRRWRTEWVGPGGVEMSAEEGVQGGPAHVAAFLAQMLAGAREAVVAELLPPDRPERACVPLMMDLDSAMRLPQSGAEDRWAAQVSDCSALAAEYPGRAFPFLAVHPARPNIAAEAAEAVETKGFLGIKVYPPLGHDPADPALDELYAWCEQRGVPVTAHCSPIGVWSDLGVPPGQDPLKRNVARAEPKNWVPVLEAHPGLRVNLAHFGGQWEALAEGRPAAWVDQARDILARYPGCYADVSYHFAALHANPEVRRAYFDELRRTLDSPIGHKVLWGTDYVILRTRCRHSDFRAAFAPPAGGLTHAEFTSIANENPRRFLGLDSPPRHYIRFVSALPHCRLPMWLRREAERPEERACGA